MGIDKACRALNRGERVHCYAKHVTEIINFRHVNKRPVQRLVRRDAEMVLHQHFQVISAGVSSHEN